MASVVRMARKQILHRQAPGHGGYMPVTRGIRAGEASLEMISSPLGNLGQLSRQLLQQPVGSNTDVGKTQTRYQSVATLNGLNQY